MSMNLTKEQKQDLIQQAARKAWKDGGEWGLLAMATGTGKSKCAIDEAAKLMTEESYKKDKPASIYLVVPTEKLRDNNWKSEFEKWDAVYTYAQMQRYCYASINKVRNQIIDLVILDEGHSLTELNSEFFQNNSVRRLMVLSATPPVKPDPKHKRAEDEKYNLFVQLRIKTDFYYSLEQAEKDGIVSSHEIWIVETALDNLVKYIEAGNKANRFFQTEQQKYEFLSRQIKQLMISKKSDVVKFKSMERRRLIAGSISKKATVKKLIDRFGQDNRTLVFGGSIAQIEELLPGAVYHSKSGKAGDKALSDFQSGAINILGCVEALNEGINILNLDVGIIAQVSSNARDLIQRIGRLIRHRPNHTSVIFIVVAIGTQDEEWLAKALGDMDRSKLRYVHAKNL